MGMTIAEKILSKRNVTGSPAAAGDLVDCRIDGMFVHDAYRYVKNAYEKIGFVDGPPGVWDKDKFYLMTEHHQPPATALAAANNQLVRQFAQRVDLKYFYDAECGICHQMMFDYGHVRPGELVLGTDSHTTIYGALNAAGTGIASEEAAYAMAFGELWFQVPQTIKVVLQGAVPPYPIGKEIVLTLAGRYGDNFAQYHALEYTGPAIESLSLDTRMCIACHGVEVGAKFAFFPADERVQDFVKRLTGASYEPVAPDQDATYLKEIGLNVSEIGFPVACPHRFDNVVPIEEVEGVKIDQALLGSCANGRFEDISLAARMLKGKRVHPRVRFYVEPASWGVYRRCESAGLFRALRDAGAQVLQPGCWICDAHGCVLADGEACITCTTRNYRGRKGSPKADLYLAGPATVTAAAIAGRIVSPEGALDGIQA
jgi:3-isopropylmalate/(R)-2-methylmalate dehydratase large subunit